MATNPNATQITPPRVPIIDERTGAVSREWYRWFYSLYNFTGGGTGVLPVTSGGTGLDTIPTNGQLLIGNGTGYSLNTLGVGAGISVVNGVGTITLANTGVLSFSSGTTGLTPATATTGDVTLAGTLIAANGGTGFASYAIGDLLYADTTITLAKLPDVATGNALISGGVNTAPSWGKIGLTTHVSGVLSIANGGTNGSATPTAYGVAYGTGTAYAFTAAGTDKQVLIANTSAAPTWSTLTSGTSILYGDGSGGFSNVTIGSGISFVAGTLSATGSGGTVTSVSFTGGIITVATPTTTPALTVAGTSGGVPYFSSTSTWASSAALAANAIVLGGGAGAAPATTTTGTGVVTALGVNTGTAGAFVVNGGALGTPSSGTVTNLTGTASININGTVGATTANTGAFTTLSATGVTTVQAGTAGLPAITTSGDTNTGIFFPAADTVGVSTGGTERIRVDSAGSVAIGNTSPSSARTVTISRNITGGINSTAVRSDGVVQSDVTNAARGFHAINSTAASAFTLTSLYSFYAEQTTIGATSTVTSQYGYFADASLIGATNNYGFYGNIASGANRYNFYANGTAPNLFSGNVQIFGAGSLGYTTGSGGSVTQGTSRTTGVTLNKTNGAITMFTAVGSAIAATFTVTNSTVAATDTIIVNQKSGTNLYVLLVTAVAAGSFNITFYTTGGIASDAPVINFSVIKAVTA